MNCRTAAATLACVLVACAVAAENTAVFTAYPPNPAPEAASLSEIEGRSDADCVMKCWAADRAVCASSAFLSGSKRCLLSGVKAADFSIAAPGIAVYRKHFVKINERLAEVGSRTFRIMLHRSKGLLGFARTWLEYEDGFADDIDSWIGLRSLHELTGSTPTLLRVEARNWSDALFVSEYSGFSVAGANTNYTMTYTSYLSGESNTTQDSLAACNGMQFSTVDRDNDLHADSCSIVHRGGAGWWFKNCANCNPTGLYHPSAVHDGSKKMLWYGAGNSYAAIKSIRLMLLVN